MEWMPIETAPKDWTRVDLWDGEQRIPDCWFEGWRWWTKSGYDECPVNDPTHWMPLPPPPSLESKKDE